jgi:hypothetical protein
MMFQCFIVNENGTIFLLLFINVSKNIALFAALFANWGARATSRPHLAHAYGEILD